MAAVLLPNGKQQYLSASGVPLAGGSVTTYDTGTTTPRTTWADAAQSAPNPNPIILDARGEAAIFWSGAYRVVIKDALGNTIWTMDGISDLAYGAGIIADLAIANNATKGAGMVGYLTSTAYPASTVGGFLNSIYGRTAVETSTGVTPSSYQYPPGHAFRYMSASVITNVLAYNYLSNVTTAVQSAMNVAWSSQIPCYCPGGGYLIDGLTMPGAAAFRYRSFEMHGDGVGEIFARTLQGGTIFQGTGNTPAITYTPDSPNTGNGQALIYGMRFEWNSNTYVLNFGSLYGQSYLHDIAVYQGGIGGGIQCQLSNTTEFNRIYIINRDWNTAGLGLARVGIGLNTTQSINTGLSMFRKITSRGFLTAYNIGNGTTSAYVNKFEHCECSVVRNGFIINANTSGTVIDSCYLEGGDGGTAITDNGNYTKVLNTLSFAGWIKHIDSTNGGLYGSRYDGNILSAGSVASCILIDIASTGASGGPGKSATNNMLTYSGSGTANFTASITATTMTVTAFASGPALVVGMEIAGAGVTVGTTITGYGTGTGGIGTYPINPGQVVGSVAMTGLIPGVNAFRIAGIEPRLNLSGNVYDPRGLFVGGTGTMAINDTSTSGGNYGLTQAKAGALEFPYLSRGGMSLGEGATLVDANVTANVLSFNSPYHVVTMAGAQTVTNLSGFTATDLPYVTFRTTNANCSFTDSANLQMIGAVTFTGPGMITFLRDSGVWFEDRRGLN